jgi:hypothetical protein
MDPKGKGMVVNDKTKESIVNEPRDDKPTDSGSSHKKRDGKKKRRIKKIVYYNSDESYSSPRDDDDEKRRANSLYAIGKYTRSLCATGPTCHRHQKIYLYATQWYTRNEYKI